MSLNRGIGSVQFMKKRIPRNEKYQHVKSRLDTGCSLSKYLEKLEEIKKNYRYRKDEIFKRLKVTTFAQLVLQVASVWDLNDTEFEGDLRSPEGGSPCSDRQDAGDAGETCHTSRSTLLSVISGVGELNKDGERPAAEDTAEDVAAPELAAGPYPDSPYLLLDVRDGDQYDRCHLISAHSFPIAMLSRTMNPYPRDVLRYKNSVGKIIILYDEDERVAGQAATVMCERGFENLFLLSGGLKVVAQRFPEGLTTGAIPPSCRAPPPPSCRAPPPASCRAPPPAPPPAQRTRGSSVPPAPLLAEKRWRFTADELSKIQEQLEETLLPSTTSSRMSSRVSSSVSSLSSQASSRQSSCLSGRVQSSRPWK